MKNTDHISNMEIITFDDKEYKIRIIHVKGFGDVTVGTCSLQGVLFDSYTSEYTSSEAKEIDEGIFFYVEDKYISFDDKKLATHVERNIA